MDINWKAPFEFAFELGLWLLGSIMVLFVIFVAVVIVWAIVRGFFKAIKMSKENNQSKPKLKSVD